MTTTRHTDVTYSQAGSRPINESPHSETPLIAHLRVVTRGTLDMDLPIGDDDTVIIGGPTIVKRPARRDIVGQHQDAPSEAVLAIRRLLLDSAYGDLQRIEVSQRGDSIILSGKLPSYFLKQTAQEIVRKEQLRKQIVNEIQVG